MGGGKARPFQKPGLGVEMELEEVAPQRVVNLIPGPTARMRLNTRQTIDAAASRDPLKTRRGALTSVSLFLLYFRKLQGCFCEEQYLSSRSPLL